MNYKIYTLADPDTKEIKYVGKTKKSLLYRLQQHIYEAFRYKSYKASWIKSLLQENKIPIIELLDETNEDWQSLEMYWITQMRSWGFHLVNMTDGGDGNHNQVITKETKQKISQALKGKKRPQEVKDKISKAHTGKQLSESTKKKLKQANFGKKQSETTKKKRYKSVLLVDEQGSILERFDSIMHAAEKHGCSKGAISNTCHGRTKTACRKYWKFG